MMSPRAKSDADKPATRRDPDPAEFEQLVKDAVSDARSASGKIVDDESTADPQIQYALKFLTYAYSVPFRRLALEQELIDVFDFTGEFDPAFLARWDSMFPPERAAFCQSYREYRRMEALDESLSAVDKKAPAGASLEERSSHFVAAHFDGLDAWQKGLRDEARHAPKSSATASVYAVPAATSVPGPLASSPMESPRGAPPLISQMLPADDADMQMALESLAPIDDLAQAVLESISASEMKEAQARFLARVRWLLNLPNQQRMAVALRSIGRKRREIAAAMNISDESVKTHLARADDSWAKASESAKPSRRNAAKAARRRQTGSENGFSAKV